jgi:aryl-alcohol dehydrogenase-like predicted oxidoreductase
VNRAAHRGATAEGTRRYADRCIAAGVAVPSHFREARGLTLASVGIGTYLGAADDATDAAYRASIVSAVRHGTNVVDLASVYRGGRSERAAGAALRTLFEAGHAARDEIVVASKAGYVPRAEREARPDLGQHAIAPDFLSEQLTQSLRRTALDTLDVFFVHNVEVQLESAPREEFLARVRDAFARLEEEVREGRIGRYGVSTWNGLRAAPDDAGYLSLAELAAIAIDVGGEDHHFRVVQLPFNLLMLEALTLGNQAGTLPTRAGGGWDEPPEAVTLLDAAAAFGLSVWTSAALFQARLALRFPREIAAALPGLTTNAQRALQFARSTPGVTTALVGTTQAVHAAENMLVARKPPLARDRFLAAFFQGS